MIWANPLYVRDNTMTSTATVLPFVGFNPTADCEALKKSMKGMGCKKAEITKILTKRSNHQRQEIAKTYESMFDKKLLKELASELSGDYEKLILAMMEPSSEYLAGQLYAAMAKVGTDEKTLIQIICSRQSAEIQEIALAYQKKYEKGTLLEKIQSEVKGDFQNLLRLLLTVTRKSGIEVNQDQATHQAKVLMAAGALRKGTDEASFSRLMAVESYAQLRAVFEEYRKVAGECIEEAIKKETSGDYREALLTIVQCAKNLKAYYASELKASMAGLGTNEASLVRLIVSHAEKDLGAIKAEYEKLYGHTLVSAVKKETSGDFAEALVALIGS